MVTETYSGMVLGIEGNVITVQADISNGLPVFHMVGSLSPEVREAGERIRTAFKNIGLRLPAKRVTVNLAPANLKKKGTTFDLAIAIGLFVSMDLISSNEMKDYLLLGELSLDGSICKIDGTLPILKVAYEQGFRKCIIPRANVNEASLIDGMDIYAFDNLKDIYDFFLGKIHPDRAGRNISNLCESRFYESINPVDDYIDFSQIKGQELAKRALTIGAAGFHNIFLDGPPGVGKSMLAESLPGILPEMTQEEIIESTMIYSVKGLLDENNQWILRRPFRNPGHAITKVGLFGGGSDPKPGEISLAHNGVLFMDEFTEYKKDILEMLRRPLEDHRIHLVRSERNIPYPADFLLVAASNPCPCGYYPDRSRCRCNEAKILRYQNKLSGPILDRMDLFVQCERIDFKTIYEDKEVESSDQIRKKVMDAWKIQQERYRLDSYHFNGRMTSEGIKKYCALRPEDHQLLEKAFDAFSMTGRSLNRVLKVARTIADLDQSENIKTYHIEEALMYRRNRKVEGYI